MAAPTILRRSASVLKNRVMTEPLSPADVTADHFRPHIDKDFRIPGWPHPMALTAVETGNLKGGQADAGRREPFTLIFRGPPREVMREGFYTLQLDGGPWFNLYIMPILTAGNDRQDYQALFN
jgi:hypothetical protein